jgi:hypothetical protein
LGFRAGFLIVVSSLLCAAHWNPFLDPESDIFGYTWCVGTSLGSCDVLPHTDPHLQLGIMSPDMWTYSAILTDVDLPEGAYYITIRATNQIAYGGPLFTTVQHATPYIIDTTPPVVEEDVDVGYNLTTNQLSVEYDASDGEEGVVTAVDVALGRSPLDTDILRWTPLTNQSGSVRSRGVVELVIPDGLPVWLKLRATDGGKADPPLGTNQVIILN